MTDLRAVLQTNLELSSKYRDAMDAPIIAFADRFRAMKLKDEPIGVNFPAKADDITDMVENVRFIESSVSEDVLSSAVFNNSPALAEFVKSHCHASQYAFQIQVLLLYTASLGNGQGRVQKHFISSPTSS
jgi:hypothetical protein